MFSWLRRAEPPHPAASGPEAGDADDPRSGSMLAPGTPARSDADRRSGWADAGMAEYPGARSATARTAEAARAGRARPAVAIEKDGLQSSSARPDSGRSGSRMPAPGAGKGADGVVAAKPDSPGTPRPGGGGLDPEQLLRRLEWTVIRRLDGLLQGDYRTLFRGFGLDLADLREYQPQDDVRHIDWNVTARLQVPHVREFQEDRQVDAWFLLDLSGSIDFGSNGIRKRLLSTEFTAVLARLLTRYGNRVGALLYCGSAPGVAPARTVPAGAGRRHVLHLLAAIDQRPSRTTASRTDLAGLLRRAQQTLPRRSVVFVVSDFISDSGWAAALDLLARRHETVAVRLFDPLEREIPDLGLVMMQDAETGEQLLVDTHDPGFRRRFAQQAQAREATLRETLARLGIDCLELATDEPIDEALLRFTDARQQRSRLAAGSLPAVRRSVTPAPAAQD